MTRIIGTVVLLLAATSALATVPAWVASGPSPVTVGGVTGIPCAIGSPTDVYIVSSGSGTTSYMDLYMTSYDSAHFPFTDEAIYDIGGIFTTSNTYTGATISKDYFPDNVWISTSATSSIAVADGAKIAKVTITVPLGTAYGTHSYVDATWAGTPSTFDLAVMPLSFNVVATPEPVSALLLLAGLPLLRRRRA
jgi:hypothetical protein